jgi:FkbM family methyltransferase
MIQQIKNTLDSYSKLCLIDIGYHKGHFTQDFLKLFSNFSRSNIKIIGVDPIDYGVILYDKFYNNAISSKEGDRNFFMYDEPGCNSLSEMNFENLTNKKDGDGWYCRYNINRVGEKTIKAITLEQVIKESNEDLIHFLKIDTQGNDIDVIKSGDESINKVLFIQMESCVAKNESQLMYKNQTTMQYDVEYMLSKNFKLIDYIDYSADAPPEANLFFVNQGLIQ